jgi:adenylate cyclase
LSILYFAGTRRYRFFRTSQLLHVEQAKSDRLLLNILPKQIADILKDESRTIADQDDQVSVLFADAVNFTPMSALMTPVESVELLNAG